MQNPYETLGVDPSASADTIKRAYRKKAKRHHPDNPKGDRASFEQINRASLILLNPERRAKFDATGDAEEASPDNSQALAVSLIVGFIAAVVQQAAKEDSNPCRVDLVAFARENFRNRISDFEKQKVPIERAAKLMRTIEQKLKLSTGSKEHPMLRKALEAQARGLHEPLQRIEREIAVHKDALILLNGYVFDADKPAPVQTSPYPWVKASVF